VTARKDEDVRNERKFDCRGADDRRPARVQPALRGTDTGQREWKDAQPGRGWTIRGQAGADAPAEPVLIASAPERKATAGMQLSLI